MITQRHLTHFTLLLAVCSHAGLALADDFGLAGFSSGYRYTINHTAPDAGTLTDFQVKIQINTAGEIDAGRMNADCSDLRVYDGDGCAPTAAVNFWVADGTCNTPKTDVWLGLPSIAAGSTTPLAIFWGKPSATSLSNGPAVFPLFFDDFNGPTFDTTKWNSYGSLSQANGRVTTGGGAVGLWTKDTVLAAGLTVYGVRTNAQAAGGADIEYGAATLIAPSGGSIHWASRVWSGVTWMAYNYSFASIGQGPASGGVCANRDRVGPKWTNDPGDLTYFQTEFFYELDPGGGSTFGIYDKYGVKREITLGNASCSPAAIERAYWQFDHSAALPNPISSVDYVYVRKYAKPDPVVVTAGVAIGPNSCVANGQGPCATDTAGTICQSAACSPHGSVCIPNQPGSCFVDDDCTTGHFCAQSTYTCTDQLSPATALPTDGLHDACSATHTNSACLSGQCNPTTATCASATGDACASAAACVVNACGSDSLCGYPGDEGSCTSSDATVCRSGRCRPTGTCLSVTGCLHDTECASGTYCSDGTNTCVAQRTNGSAIPDGHGSCGGTAGSLGSATTPCLSGACNPTAGTCAGPNTSTACTTHAECVTNICGGDGSCGSPDGEGSCSGSTDTSCRSGLCSVHGSVCIPNQGGSCWVDADCGGTEYCARSTFTCTAKRAVGDSLPSDGLHAVCPPTEVNSSCASGQCNLATATCAVPNSQACVDASHCVSNTCGAGGLCGFASGTGSCTASTQLDVCRSGVCGAAHVCIPAGGCTTDVDCGPNQFCEGSSLACVPALGNGAVIPSNHGVCGGAPGSVGDATRACASAACNATSNTCADVNLTTSCTVAAECVENICGANGRCGLVAGAGPCTVDLVAPQCQSGVCSPNGTTCIPAGVDRCWVDADCSGVRFCNRSTMTCSTPLSTGTALLADGLHSLCPPTEVNASCSSGHCNAETGTCAAANGQTCTRAAECISNVCGTDGHCGLGSGEGPCTTGTQGDVCRSGFCASARCVPGSGCGSDADCPASQFCSQDTFSCHSKLANAAQIPAGHGTCGSSGGEYGTAARACESGLCNVMANTCAGETGTSCTSNAQCVVNVCGLNSRCGSVDGSGVCTTATALARCQSGRCSEAGQVCRPVGNGTCAVDGDCASNEACHSQTLRCVLRGPLGSEANPYDASTVKVRGGGGCSAGGNSGLGTFVVLGVLGLLVARRKAVLTVACVLIAGSAQAQYQGFSLNRYSPSRGGSEWGVNESLDFKGERQVSLGLISDMAFDPLVLSQTSGAPIRPVVDKQFVAHLVASVSVFERLRLGLSLPVPFFQSGTALSTTSVSFPAPRTTTVGDLRASVDGVLFKSTRFRLGLGLDLLFPTGQGSDYVSEVSPRFSPRVTFAGDINRFSYAANLAYLHRPIVTPAQAGGLAFGPELLTTAGVGYRIQSRFFVGPEIYTSTVLGSYGSAPAGATTVEVLLTGRANLTREWRLGVGVARGLTQTIGSPAFRLLVSIEFNATTSSNY